MITIRSTALAVAALLFLAGGVVLTPGPAVAAAAPSSTGVVYLFRGAFNIFSTGMDQIAKKLRARGIEAKSTSYADWPAFAAEAKTRYAQTHLPIILVGHSFGANAAVLLAAKLEESHTPVALLILFDTVSSMKISANVRRAIDFVSTDGRGAGITVTGELGFVGGIDRVKLREGHLAMDTDRHNQDISIAAILKVI
jgi:thioesterase domain-containing protein